MYVDEFIANMKLKLNEETEIPNPDGYKFHGNGHTKKRPRRWQKAFDVVDEFIDSDMEIASVNVSQIPSDIRSPIRLECQLANNICTYARKQGIVAKKRGDKVYLIKDKEN